MVYGATTLSITAFSITTLSKWGLHVTLSISDTQHNNALPLYWMSLCSVSCFIYYYAECHHAECRYAECRYVECHGAVCACARFKKWKIKRFLNLKWLGFEAWKEQPLATLIFHFKICPNFLKFDLSGFFCRQTKFDGTSFNISILRSTQYI
jgi:hypothetical protein